MKFPCPCCGYKTLISLSPFDCICPVCWWHYDGQDNEQADEVWGGPNGDLSLTQARRNFIEFGISEPLRTDLLSKRKDARLFERGRVFEIVGDRVVERK